MVRPQLTISKSCSNNKGKVSVAEAVTSSCVTKWQLFGGNRGSRVASRCTRGGSRARVNFRGVNNARACTQRFRWEKRGAHPVYGEIYFVCSVTYHFVAACCFPQIPPARASSREMPFEKLTTGTGSESIGDLSTHFPDVAYSRANHFGVLDRRTCREQH